MVLQKDFLKPTKLVPFLSSQYTETPHAREQEHGRYS